MRDWTVGGAWIFVRDGFDRRQPQQELPGQDSNLDKQNQNLQCYRYTTG
jgi:hypothetical protein